MKRSTFYSIIGLDNSGKIVSHYGKLYDTKEEVTLRIAELQIKEYERLQDSINEEAYVEDAKEERDEANEALEQFFFDCKFGTKMYGLDYEPKYHVPMKFQILEHLLEIKDNEK